MTIPGLSLKKLNYFFFPLPFIQNLIYNIVDNITGWVAVKFPLSSPACGSPPFVPRTSQWSKKSGLRDAPIFLLNSVGKPRGYDWGRGSDFAFASRFRVKVKIRPINGNAPAARNTGAYPAPPFERIAGEQGEYA